MIDVALAFLVKSLNGYLKARTGSAFGAAELTRLVDDGGKWAVTTNSVGVSLVNVEEDRVLKAQVPDVTYVNGAHVVLPPPLKVNLHVIFAANLAQYDQALRYLSYVLAYFQAHPTFTQTDSPELDPRIERLSLELLSLGYDQLSQMWTFIGGKQLPSIVYRVRVVILQDEDEDVAVPITGLVTEVHGA